jgi:hypothetical protein
MMEVATGEYESASMVSEAMSDLPDLPWCSCRDMLLESAPAPCSEGTLFTLRPVGRFFVLFVRHFDLCFRSLKDCD